MQWLKSLLGPKASVGALRPRELHYVFEAELTTTFTARDGMGSQSHRY